MSNKILFPNGGMADQAIETPVSPAMQTLVNIPGSNEMVAKTNSLTWTPMIAGSSKWTSAASVAYVTETVIAMRGTFTSTSAANTDPIGLFPLGYKPAPLINVAIPATLSATLAPNVATLTPNTGAHGQLITAATIGNGDVINVDFFYMAAAAQ